MASELDLDRLTELEAKATKGKWEAESIYVGSVWSAIEKSCIVTDGRPADAALIAALRNAAPALIAAAREAERLRALLRNVEWNDHTTDWSGAEWDVCPECDGLRPRGDKVFNNGRRLIGHHATCRLAAAIAPKD